MLLGRDIVKVHQVHKQVSGPNDTPFAQKLDLGWVNVCLSGVHRTVTVNAFYTNMTERARPTCFQPCPNLFNVKEKPCGVQISCHNVPQPSDRSSCESDHLGCRVFEQTKNDNQVAPPIQDKSPRQILPNNRPQAMNRLTSLIRNFDRKPEMRDHFVAFVEKIFQNGHAEIEI